MVSRRFSPAFRAWLSTGPIRRFRPALFLSTVLSRPMKRIPIPDDGLVNFFGVRDENLRYLEDLLNIQISSRGGELFLEGEEDNFRVIEKLLWQLTELMESGYKLSKSDFKTAVELLCENPQYELKNFFLDNRIKVSSSKSLF